MYQTNESCDVEMFYATPLIAYFTASSYVRRRVGDSIIKTKKEAGYPYVAAIDPVKLEIIRTYAFHNTYDSTPLVIERKDGRMLVIAHEHRNARSVAMDAETGEVVWISDNNQPGSYFFGYSYFVLSDGTKLIFIHCNNGLHAMSLENGADVWHVSSRGGVTPCVDQEQGVIYYQSDGRLDKINAENGNIISSLDIEPPAGCISWNTVLVNDDSGYFIATYWYSPVLYGSAIRVFDKDLKMVWARKGLPMSKKPTLTYHEGQLFAGCGCGWLSDHYEKEEPSAWKNIRAYAIGNGKVIWELDLAKYHFSNIPNIIYCDGKLIAETQGGFAYGYHVFIINALDGTLQKICFSDKPASSCAPPVFTAGKLFSGDILSDNLLVTKIGAGDVTDWIGAFGCARRNHMCAPDGALRNCSSC